MKNEDFLKFDLHIHSKYSFDCLTEPAKIVSVAMRKGLNGVAITDHNTIQGGISAQRYIKKTRETNFILIIGAEIATEYGDIIGLFLQKEIKSRKFLEVIEEIKEQNGVVVLSHPYKRRNYIRDEVIKNVHVIEVFNARGEQGRITQRNKRALELAQATGLPMCGGSDAHFYFEIGNGYSLLKENVKNNFDLRKLLLEGKLIGEGVNSPLLSEPITQVIKVMKTRSWEITPYIIRRTGGAILDLVGLRMRK